MGGYTFYWSGRSADERRESGVGFAMKTKLIRNFSNLPKGTNDRLMTMQIPIGKDKHVTLISAYAPTMTNPDEVKNKFYKELNTIISAVPKGDKLILLGDFNARVGVDHEMQLVQTALESVTVTDSCCWRHASHMIC